MNDKCYYCIYRDKSREENEHAYGCESADIGMCGEPGNRKRR